MFFLGEQISLQRVFLKFGHGTKFHFHQNHAYHHHDSQKSIEVIRNSTDKQGQTIFALYKTADCCCPGRNGSDDTDRSCCGIDQVSQLCAGYIVAVCYRTHNTADSQTVKIVIDKDQYTQKYGGQLSAHS